MSNEVKEGRRIGVNGIDDSKDGRRYFWHSDSCYVHKPPMGTTFRSVVLPKDPKDRGDTLFANMYLALENLDDATRDRLQGRRQVMDWTKTRDIKKAKKQSVTDEQLKSTPLVVSLI